jgi:RNA polymerase sigma factor (TIGR02999 family)
MTACTGPHYTCNPGAENSTLVSVATAIAELLERSRAGQDAALDELIAVLYSELHRVASRHLRGERAGHTLQTTALVHEVYMKLAGDREFGFNDRAHFLSVASRAMRQVLVDYARSRGRRKRGGDEPGKLSRLITGVPMEAKPDLPPVELLDMDRALAALASEDASLARLVEMRYFGGMTAEETAETLGQSVHVVRHDLRLAQAWLSRKLSK